MQSIYGNNDFAQNVRKKLARYIAEFENNYIKPLK